MAADGSLVQSVRVRRLARENKTRGDGAVPVSAGPGVRIAPGGRRSECDRSGMFTFGSETAGEGRDQGPHSKSVLGQ